MWKKMIVMSRKWFVKILNVLCQVKWGGAEGNNLIVLVLVIGRQRGVSHTANSDQPKKSHSVFPLSEKVNVLNKKKKKLSFYGQQ